ISSRRRHTRVSRDWSSDVCSSDLWPIPEPPSADVPLSGSQRDAFARRLGAYMTKACREAKRETRWTAPDARYEAAIAAAVERLRAEERRVGKEVGCRWEPSAERGR